MRKFSLFLMLFLFCFCVKVHAETVILTSGKVLKGRIIERDYLRIKLVLKKNNKTKFLGRKRIFIIDGKLFDFDQKKEELYYKFLYDESPLGEEIREIENQKMIFFKEGFSAFEQKKWKEAIDIFERAFAFVFKDDKSVLYNKIGICYRQLGKNEIALQKLQQALEFEPNNVEFMLETARALILLSRHEEAQKLLLAALELDKFNPVLMYNLGNTYVPQFKYEEAMQMFLKATEFDPLYKDAFLNLANVYSIQDKYELAVDAYKKAIKLDLDNPIAKSNLAATYLKMKDVHKAIFYYDLTIRDLKKTNKTQMTEKYESIVQQLKDNVAASETNSLD